jgi:hypothetical protein
MAEASVRSLSLDEMREIDQWESHRSQSMAAMHPVPAAVIA